MAKQTQGFLPRVTRIGTGDNSFKTDLSKFTKNPDVSFSSKTSSSYTSHSSSQSSSGYTSVNGKIVSSYNHHTSTPTQEEYYVNGVKFIGDVVDHH